MTKLIDSFKALSTTKKVVFGVLVVLVVGGLLYAGVDTTSVVE